MGSLKRESTSKEIIRHRLTKRVVLLFIAIGFTGVGVGQWIDKLPDNFVYLEEVAPTIKSNLRYLTSANFIGKPVKGYVKNKVIVTRPTAEALRKIQRKLRPLNLSLKIYDAYRPQRSVNQFVRWSKRAEDTLMKKEYYPNISKKELFKLGYIASKSAHTRGSTVDLTLVDVKTNKELDMGGTFDFFGERSHTASSKISRKQRNNRLFLKRLMQENGFVAYAKEWWHFRLKNEPFTNTYFNFPVK